MEVRECEPWRDISHCPPRVSIRSCGEDGESKCDAERVVDEPEHHVECLLLGLVRFPKDGEVWDESDAENLASGDGRDLWRKKKASGKCYPKHGAECS